MSTESKGRKFETLNEGFVSIRQEGSGTAVAAGPRCAVTSDGAVVCSFVAQAALGRNDFKPILASSEDGGITWREEGLIWPQLQDTYSIFGSVSRSPAGDLFFYGGRTRIDEPGETCWSEATQGLKQNELVWAKSTDCGRTWSEPVVIPMPIPGAAEPPGAMCVTRGGRWL